MHKGRRGPCKRNDMTGVEIVLCVCVQGEGVEGKCFEICFLNYQAFCVISGFQRHYLKKLFYNLVLCLCIFSLILPKVQNLSFRSIYS